MKQAGKDRGVLVPVRWQKVRPPTGFGQLQTLDLIGWQGKITPAIQKLIDAIENKIGEPGATSSGPIGAAAVVNAAKAKHSEAPASQPSLTSAHAQPAAPHYTPLA